MGVEMLDFTFRLEKRFGIKIGRDEMKLLESAIFPLRGHLKPPDLLAGEVHNWVVALCEAQGIPVPHSSWNRVRIALSQTSGRPPQAIRPETFLARDLGFT